MASRPRSKRTALPPKRRSPKKRAANAVAAKEKAGATVAKRAAVAASRGMVEAALAAFAHEVRTPLTGILAISNLLATSDLGERERRWADTIKAGADAFLVKPVSPRALATALHEATRRGAAET